MRRAFATLILITVLAAALRAQSGTYTGVIVRDSEPRAHDHGYVGQVRLHVRVAGHRTLASVGSGPSRADSDSGWVVRWGDTLFAVMHNAYGDTTVWSGVRHGGGFVGLQYRMWKPDFITRTRFSVNLASGDSLRTTRLLAAGFREAVNAYLASLDLRVEKSLAESYVPPPAKSTISSDDVLGYVVMLVFFGPYALLILRPIVKRVRSARDAARQRWLRARSRWRERQSATRIRYSVPCPICRTAQMEAAQEYYMIRGRGLFTSLDRRVVFGCEPCVRRAGLRSAASVLLDGTWSLGGVIAAPCSALFNVMRALDLHDRALVERLIREAGLEPVMVRLDEDGLVPADRAKLNTHLWICARLMWADGVPPARAHEEAIKSLIYVSEGRLKTARLEQLLVAMRGKPAAHRPIPVEERAAIYEFVKRLVVAHGQFSAPMSAAVHEIAALIGLPRHDLTELLREITDALRMASAPNAGASAGARQKADGAGAGSSRTGGGESSAKGDPNAGKTRRRRISAEEIARARTVLNVGPAASAEEIERAYRTVISIWHPDRAGLDPRRQKEFTLRSQEITWAKEALRVAAQAQVAS